MIDTEDCVYLRCKVVPIPIDFVNPCDGSAARAAIRFYDSNDSSMTDPQPLTRWRNVMFANNSRCRRSIARAAAPTAVYRSL